jgi:hypothetical protein
MSESEVAAPRKKRPPYATIFTVLACIAGVLQFVHEIAEANQAAIRNADDALRHVDLYGLANGYVNGINTWQPEPGLGLWAPIAAFGAGVHGAWEATVAGGWLAIVAGIGVTLCGIALAVYVLAEPKEGKQRGPVALLLGCAFMVVILGAMGLFADALIAHVFSESAFGTWLAGNLDELGGGAAHNSGSTLVDFVMTHVAFSVVTLVVGVIFAAAVGALAKLTRAEILAAFFLPFAALAVLLAGAAVASLIDHIIVIPAFDAILVIASMSAVPLGLGAVAFILEKGHLGISLVESTRKLSGRE